MPTKYFLSEWGGSIPTGNSWLSRQGTARGIGKLSAKHQRIGFKSRGIYIEAALIFNIFEFLRSLYFFFFLFSASFLLNSNGVFIFCYYNCYIILIYRNYNVSL